jgi:hypothetical protein
MREPEFSDMAISLWGPRIQPRIRTEAEAPIELPEMGELLARLGELCEELGAARCATAYQLDAPEDIPEVWEINYEDEPPRGFGEWMHDYRTDSGENRAKKRFPVRRIRTQDYLDDFMFSQDYSMLIGASREGRAQVLDLDLAASRTNWICRACRTWRPGSPGTSRGGPSW